MNERLRTEYEKLDAREALQSSPAILLGVTQSAAAALKQVKIESVFDLASSRLFANASRLLKAGLDSKDPYYRYGISPKDMVDAAAGQRPIDELRFEGIGILAGVGAATAATLAKELDIKTVRDLALWPPYEAARAILNEVYFPELEVGFDPDAPADLLPKSGEYPTERVFYQTLVLDQIDAQPDKDITQAGPIDIAPTLDQSFGFKSLGVGALLTIAQSWYAKGVALGQLLHSTTLAPGESTRIAMMDWSRRTKAGTTETISETEQLDNETMHSRALSEVTSALARESQQGFSSTESTSTSTQKGTSKGSATINADPVNALSLGMFGDDPGVTTSGSSESESTVASSGMTFTSSSGQRSVAASVNQNVLDRTQQHSNSVRNRRASVIREVSQEEHQSVSTRVVTNYNHMHALSIQYYEIVQIYRVEVGISKAEKCLFVPMKLVDFNQAVIDKYRLVLARAARERNIRELLTTRYGVVELAPQTPKVSVNTLIAKAALSQIARTTLRENLFELVTATPLIPTSADATPPPVPPIATKDLSAIRPSMLDVVAAKGYDIAQLGSASRLLGRPLIQSGSDSVFLPDDTIITGLLVRDGYATKLEAKVRGEVTRIGISTNDQVSLTRALQVTEIESIYLKNGTDKEQVITLQLQCSYFGVFFPLNLKVRAAVDDTELEVIRFGSVRAAKELIDHLNTEKLHYSQAIYRSLDASTLALLLSPYKYEDKPLAQVIDPTPVTITANYLVFKMHEEEFLAPAVGAGDEEEPAPPQLSQWGHWLKDHGIDNSVSAELVPLPSGGVFAEAVLGRYNGAEKLDMTRFWNWQDSPIPITAPDISPVELTSRGTTEDLKPGQLGAPVVSIVNPTALPDPTGMAAVLQAVQNGNMFRDMSGLAATMGLAQAGISAASQGATAAGAQAGSNAATAAQLFSDLAKTAATVATMGVGGVAGGAIGIGGGLLGASANKGAGGNISTAGALLNQAKDMSGSGRGGNALTPATTVGAADGSAPDYPNGGSALGFNELAGPAQAQGPAMDEQVMRSAIWGAPGTSQNDFARGMFTRTSGGVRPFYVDPDSFDFKPDPETTNWQVTSCVVIRFTYGSPFLRPMAIDVGVKVGVPLKLRDGRKISVREAQLDSANAATAAGEIITAMLDAGAIGPTEIQPRFVGFMFGAIVSTGLGYRVNGCRPPSPTTGSGGANEGPIDV